VCPTAGLPTLWCVSNSRTANVMTCVQQQDCQRYDVCPTADISSFTGCIREDRLRRCPLAQLLWR